MAAILRSLDGRDVQLNINSPGGDVYTGLAIYNLLKDYQGQVTARVMGIAASAASFIAMAADKVEIGKAAVMMIHNTQTIAAGDRHELQAVADWMAPFDSMLAEIYADKSGKDPKAIGKMLDASTWLYGQQAVDAGLADGLLSVDDTTHDGNSQATNSIRQIEHQLRARGLSRSESQSIISNIKSALSDSGAGGTGDPAPTAVNPINEILAFMTKGQ